MLNNGMSEECAVAPSNSSDWVVVTVTYNSADQLATHWARSDLRDGCWIVVDNGSSDRSVEVAESLGARVIRAPRNGGFSYGNNLGLAASESKYVGFVNPDAAVSSSDLMKLQGHIEQFGGLVAPQLTYPDGTIQPNGRGLPTIWAKLLHRLVPGFGGYRRVAALGESVGVSWAMGAAVFGERRVFEDVGNWSEDFFLYYEDAEIGLRAWATGVPVTVCGSTRVVHEWGRATSRFRWSAWKRELAAARVFYAKFPRLLLPSVVSGRRFRAFEELSQRCCHD